MSVLYGGVEAGGTKFICAAGTGPGDLVLERIPTTTPEETISRVASFFRKQKGIAAIGIGSFGPIDLNPSSPGYGHITTTPKPGWANVDLAGEISRALKVPTGFETDVNVAALGEYMWGAAQGLNNFIYLTIGTGIGGGGMINGRLMHGLIHPEMGHIRIPHDKSADPFPGCCPFHGDCLEGLASGRAVEERWGWRGEELPAGHHAWIWESYYLALAIANFICILSPERVIIGGGLMQQTQLYPMIRNNVVQLLNGYIQSETILKDIDSYIVPPGLGSRSGVAGAICLAMQSLK